MYERILLATDGTSSSTEAEEHAIELAATLGSTLHVISVVDERIFGAYPGDEYIHEHEGLEEALVSEAEQTLDKVEERANRSDVEIATHLRHGDPVEEILKLIESEDADLAIVGTSEAEGSYSELLGSVAERVAHRAQIPVLIVKSA